MKKKENCQKIIRKILFKKKKTNIRRWINEMKVYKIKLKNIVHFLCILKLFYLVSFYFYLLWIHTVMHWNYWHTYWNNFVFVQLKLIINKELLLGSSLKKKKNAPFTFHKNKNDSLMLQSSTGYWRPLILFIFSCCFFFVIFKDVNDSCP